ncbi:MAG: ABC transporter ATP-binding protein [Proteobacteria bacterium]|nr:MAG: ABC transporter ATP-binding protein [Pseudomonadota bacterium]
MSSTPSLSPAAPIVSIRDLQKSFLSNSLFEGLNLQLERGRFYALLGKNGSGKSTLVKILAHREVANSGTCQVLGVGLDEDFGAKANQIGFVSELNVLNQLDPGLTFLEQSAAFFQGWNPETADRLVKGFHLDLSKRLRELSRGQQVQLNLVLNLSYHPELIILDEVTSVLDASARDLLMQELVNRVGAGATVVLATNIVTEVQGFATYLILLGEKKVKAAKSTAEISEDFYKIEKRPGDLSAIFQLDSCIEVGLSLRNHPQFLILKTDVDSSSGIDRVLSDQDITATDIFIYLTRLRS